MLANVADWLTIPAGWPVTAVCAVALAVAVGLLARGYRAVADTTLVPAWLWSLAAVAALAAVPIAASAFPRLAAAEYLVPLQLAAATLSFCPVIALLGAMRPQHHYWNFIVLSAWVMLALPAAEAFFMNRGQRLEISDARAWFLWIMILLGPVNFLATRFAASAVLVAAGQFVLFAEHLPLVNRPVSRSPLPVALVLMSGALVAALLAARSPQTSGNPYDRLWRGFRDSFGMLWGLRFAERVNAAAAMYGWSFRLNWSGLRDADGRPVEDFDPAVEQQLRATLRGLLRRFISPARIAQQLGSDLD